MRYTTSDEYGRSERTFTNPHRAACYAELRGHQVKPDPASIQEDREREARRAALRADYSQQRHDHAN